MPKPIKKKVAKKTKPAEDIKSSMIHAREFYDGRRSTVVTSAVVVLSIVILVAGLWLYQRHRDKQAAGHEAAGYNAFHNIYQQGKSDEERFKTALEEFNKAYALKKSPSTMFYIAGVQQSMGKTAEAQETLKKIIASTPASNEIVPLAWYKLFEIFKADNLDDKALEALKSLVELKGEFYKDAALYEWAKLLNKQGKKADAAVKFDEIVKTYPSSPYLGEAKAEIAALKGQAGTEKSETEKIDTGRAGAGKSAAAADKK
jgi:tetratricopeptide (TPR) repeat protein